MRHCAVILRRRADATRDSYVRATRLPHFRDIAVILTVAWSLLQKCVSSTAVVTTISVAGCPCMTWFTHALVGIDTQIRELAKSCANC